MPATRELAINPKFARGTATSRLVNTLSAAVGAERYLEIGIRNGATLEAVRTPIRVGVDPDHSVNLSRLPPRVRIHTITSDVYFLSNVEQAFDLILLDGLHEFRQTYQDLVHALNALSKRGVVVLDDVVPSSSVAASPSFDVAKDWYRSRGLEVGDWMGEVFKAALAIIQFHPEVEVRTVVGNQRPQMVLWLRSFGPQLHASDANLGLVDALTFESVFGNGLPAGFNPRQLPEVVADLRARPSEID
jgi:hypothetical protein